MTEKQYRKADSMVFPTLMVVVVGIFLNVLGMIYTADNKTKAIIVTVVSAACAIALVVIYKQHRGTRQCGILMTTAAIIASVVMLIFIDKVFFYMVISPLFIAQMAYLEKKRVLFSALVLVPVFFVKDIILMKANAVSTTEAGSSIVILLVIIVSVYNIIKISIAFNEDNLSNVRYVSSELVTHFDAANGYVSTLDGALDDSDKAMHDIAYNIKNTGAEIQRQWQMCQDIERNTQDIKAKADMMAEASGVTLEEIKLGTVAMDKLHNHAKDVESDSKETVKNVEVLNHKTNDIKDILDAIANISMKTHLLALNATVEAARAGEAGRGFEVVANEIKNLSVQTKQATEDITDILAGFTDEVGLVTENIDRSVKRVQEQNDLIEDTKKKFDRINNEVNQLIVVINEFKNSIDNISASSVVIANGAQGLTANSDKVAMISAQSTNVMTAAVDDMQQVKVSLNQIYELAVKLKEEYKV